MGKGAKTKTIVITGGSSGIGKAAGLEIARQGHRVFLIARTEERTKAARNFIAGETKNENIDYYATDLSSSASIINLAKRIGDKYEHIDVLINNAGSIFPDFRKSEDGIEMTFALNHLAYFHLTLLLMPLLHKAEHARVVNVSSIQHRRASTYGGDYTSEKGYDGRRIYGESKLANALFTYELARGLEGTNITANCLHPGYVGTHFGEEHAGLWRWLRNRVKHFNKTPAEGAETVIYLALSPEVEGVTGKHFVDCKAVESSPLSYNEKLAKELWKKSAALTGADL